MCWVVDPLAAPAIEQNPKYHDHTMSLPPELKEEILQHLGKPDLKAVRFVAKDWSACAARYLFNRIYWSPQDKDLDVFNSLANAKFAGSVQELVFDGSQFSIDISEMFYFRHLCQHIYWLCSYWPGISQLAKSRHPMFSHLVNAIWSFIEDDNVLPESVTGDLWNTYDGRQIIEEGYAKWGELALRQRNRMGDPGFIALFASGLAKLRKFHSIYKIFLSMSFELLISLSYRFSCCTSASTRESCLAA